MRFAPQSRILPRSAHPPSGAGRAGRASGPGDRSESRRRLRSATLADGIVITPPERGRRPAPGLQQDGAQLRSARVRPPHSDQPLHRIAPTARSTRRAGPLPCRSRPARHTARHGRVRASPMPAPTSPTTASSSYNPARASSRAGAGLPQGRAPTSTELRHTNVPFSHPSEGKGQKDGRKVRSCDEAPLTLGSGSLCADRLARAARPGILAAWRVRLRRCPRRAAAGGDRCRRRRRARD